MRFNMRSKAMILNRCFGGIFIAVSLFMLFLSSANAAWYDDAHWDDIRFQYRIPVEVTPSSTGLQVLDITPDSITAAINQNEDIKYNPKHFDYNRVQVVEYTVDGATIGIVPNAGFYLTPVSGEMVYNGSFELVSGTLPTGWVTNAPTDFEVVAGVSHDSSNCVRITSETSSKHALWQGPLNMEGGFFYLLSYWIKATQLTYNPSVQFTETTSSSGPTRELSYMPALFSKYWTQYEAMIYEPDNIDLLAVIYRSLTGEAFVDDVSVKKARIDLMLEIDTVEPKRYMLYYQPSQAGKMVLPEKRSAAMPPATATPSFVGDAEKYVSRTSFVVAADPAYDIWFAETTQKIIPQLGVPSTVNSQIKISCARNERQSFQLVVNANDTFDLDTAEISALTTGSDTIPAGEGYVKIVDYAYMSDQSRDAYNYIPYVADIMETFTPQSLTAGSDNLVLWFTVIIDENTVPGT